MKCEINSIIAIIAGLVGLIGIIYLNGFLGIGIGYSIKSLLIALVMSIGLIIFGMIFFAGIVSLYGCIEIKKDLMKQRDD